MYIYIYIQKGIHILEYSNVFYQAQCLIWPILPSFYKGELFLPHTYQGKTKKVGKTTNISFFGWLILNSERKIVKILHCAAAANCLVFFFLPLVLPCDIRDHLWQLLLVLWDAFRSTILRFFMQELKKMMMGVFFSSSPFFILETRPKSFSI